MTENLKPQEAIQVCASDLRDSKTFEREISAIQECMQTLQLNSGTIISLDREEIIRKDKGHIVHIIPATKWLLEPSYT